MPLYTGSIKISELDPLPSAIENIDFFPLVQSSSFTTYRVDFNALETWLNVSASVISASYALSSSYALSASYALSSSYSLSGSYADSALNSNNSNVASYAINAINSQNSISSISASWASSSISASYALTSSYSNSSSYALTASNVNSSSYSLSASYAPVLGDNVPIGTIMLFATSSAPNNWLECNGSVVLIASFLDLYNAIKTGDAFSSFGYSCDSSGNKNSAGTYFKLPDLRGEFVRGWDHNRNVDIGRSINTTQSANLGTHYHGIGDIVNGDDGKFLVRSWNDGTIYNYRAIPGAGVSAISGIFPSADHPLPDVIATSNAVGITGNIRPRNVALMYCIKYSNAGNLITPDVTLAGDVINSITDTKVVKIQNVSVDPTVPSTEGQVLTYDGVKWKPSSSLAPSATTTVNKSYLFSSPDIFWVIGNDWYVFNTPSLYKIDTTSNVITFQNNFGSSMMSLYGRLFRMPDSNLHLIATRGSNVANQYSVDYNMSTNTGTNIWPLGLNNAAQYFMPISASWENGSGNPTLYLLNNTPYGGNTNQMRYYTNSNYNNFVISQANVELLSVVNHAAFSAFLGRGIKYPLLIWDYNYINKRYYFMEAGTSFLHIFHQNTGTLFDGHFYANYITYDGALALPALPSNFSNITNGLNKFIIDYDPDTGQEKGIICVSNGNDASSITTTGAPSIIFSNTVINPIAYLPMPTIPW